MAVDSCYSGGTTRILLGFADSSSLLHLTERLKRSRQRWDLNVPSVGLQARQINIVGRVAQPDGVTCH